MLTCSNIKSLSQNTKDHDGRIQLRNELHAAGVGRGLNNVTGDWMV